MVASPAVEIRSRDERDRDGVLLVDDHGLFAEALRTVLDREGVTVLPIAHSGAEAVNVARASRPMLALLDLGLPDRSGFDVGRQLLQEHPGIRLFALTARGDSGVSIEATRAGFEGVWTKNIHMTSLVRSVLEIVSGQEPAGRRTVQSRPTRRRVDFRSPEFLAEQLTSRERNVLTLLSQGHRSGEIGQRLHISSHTVRTHVQAILQKLQVHSRLEAVAFAARYGIIGSPRAT